MYCPVCGQKQATENIRFCSRCGFLLTGVNDLIINNGLIPNQPNQIEEEIKDSPRKRGIKQGLMILLVGMLLIVPLLAMLHIATNSEPFVMAIAAIISFFGGILRMIYAVMFESKYPTGKTLEQKLFTATQNMLGNQQNKQALPPQQSIPVTDYVAPPMGNWRETNDLVQPGSVTDETTRMLQNKERGK